MKSGVVSVLLPEVMSAATHFARRRTERERDALLSLVCCGGQTVSTAAGSHEKVEVVQPREDEFARIAIERPETRDLLRRPSRNRNCVFNPWRESLRCSAMIASRSRHSSNSTRIELASEVTRDTSNATFSNPLNVN